LEKSDFHILVAIKIWKSVVLFSLRVVWETSPAWVNKLVSSNKNTRGMYDKNLVIICCVLNEIGRDSIIIFNNLDEIGANNYISL
jgi:hypothetical protein